MKWISVKEQKIPVNVPIMVTDGKYICYCEAIQFDDGSYWLNGIGVYGYEWELDVEPERVTHWIDMSGLELPK